MRGRSVTTVTFGGPPRGVLRRSVHGYPVPGLSTALFGDTVQGLHFWTSRKPSSCHRHTLPALAASPLDRRLPCAARAGSSR
eukprot:8723568-Pyramimonas_sp.AAC.1